MSDDVRAWLLAARPKTLLASVAPVAVGTGLAASHGEFAAGPASAALLGALLIQVGTNLSNDYHDWARGGDTGDRVGPIRATQAGLLAPERVRRGAWVAFVAAAGTGVYLTAVVGWPVVAIGVASVAAGVAYTGGPYPLAYHGLGELFVLVFFGLVAVGGTYYVQAGALPADALVAGVGIGALDCAILVANNLRDRETDAAAGKRTLAVRLGVAGSQLEYTLLLTLGFVVPVFGVLLFGWPRWAGVALLAGLPAVFPLLRVLRHGEDPRALRPALGQTAAVTGLYGVLLAAGLALG